MSVNPRRPIFTPNPAQTTVSGVPWAPSYTGPQTVRRVTGAAALSPRAFAQDSSFGPQSSGNTITPQQYDAYLEKLTEAWAASAGMDREKLEAEIADAQEGRRNAYRIAQLQAETQRYGYDVNRETELARLKENQRQFDATHALDMQRFGLDYAKTYAEYASSPDRWFAAADFVSAAERVRAGVPPQSYSATGTPVPKTMADFSVLAGYPNPGATAPGGQASAAPGGGAAPGGQMNAAGNATTDNRSKAVSAMMRAAPPSNELGLSQQDFAVLEAARKLYEAPGELGLGAIESMRPDQKKIFQSAGARLGYSVPDWMSDYARSRPGQGRTSAA